MTYTVTAPLVLAIDEAGRTNHVYQGGIIDWLSDEQEDHFLANDLVVKAGAQRNPPAVPPAGADPADDGVKRPLKTAKHEVLVDWLGTHGGFDRSELAEQTKDQLWELIDATED